MKSNFVKEIVCNDCCEFIIDDIYPIKIDIVLTESLYKPFDKIIIEENNNSRYPKQLISEYNFIKMCIECFYGPNMISLYKSKNILPFISAYGTDPLDIQLDIFKNYFKPGKYIIKIIAANKHHINSLMMYYRR
jgi:hypothetical protein